MRRFLIAVMAVSVLFVGCGSAKPRANKKPVPSSPQSSSPPLSSQPSSASSPKQSQASGTPLPTGPNNVVNVVSFTKLHFFAPTDGWGTAVTQGTIAHTTDGGAKWSLVTPKKLRHPGLCCVLSILNANDAWVMNPKTFAVYRTQDGGGQWTKVGTVHPVHTYKGGLALTFVDASHGWLEIGKHKKPSPTGANAPIGINGPAAVDLYRTTDGGAHWTLVSSSGGKVDLSGKPGPIPWGGPIIFTSDTTGFLTGMKGSGPAVSAPSPYPWFFRTTDGGKTWKQVTLPLPSGYRNGSGMFVAPTFFGPEQGLMPVRFPDLKNGKIEDILYATHDRGRTWTRVGVIPRKKKHTFNVLDLSFASAKKAIVYRLPSHSFFETTDGGKTWEPLSPTWKKGGKTVPLPIGPVGSPWLEFLNARVGWAVIAGKPFRSPIYRTTDGGHTWIKIKAKMKPLAQQ